MKKYNHPQISSNLIIAACDGKEIDPYIVDFSCRDRCFNVDRLSEAMPRYMQVIVSALAEDQHAPAADYLPIAIAANYEEAVMFADRMKAFFKLQGCHMTF